MSRRSCRECGILSFYLRARAVSILLFFVCLMLVHEVYDVLIGCFRREFFAMNCSSIRSHFHIIQCFE